MNFRAVVQEEFATTSSWDDFAEVELPFAVPAKVDVVVCTYNSERFLTHCLKSVFANVPVRKLWVIDNFSSDNTAKIAESFGGQVIRTHLSLAASRRLSFRLVETPVFVTVDSDVVLCRDWFKRLMKFWDNSVGCVCGITVDQYPLQKAYLTSMWKIRKAEYYDIPHLPNMIARKDILVDIDFPKWILTGSVANEDYSIRDWIRQKGYKVVNVPVFVKHYTFPPLLGRKTFWYGASGRVSRYVSLRSILLRCVFSFPQSVYSALVSGNARVIPYWVRFRFEVLYGFLNYRKYFKMERK